MPGEFALPYFEVEMVIAAIMRRDVRDMAHVLFNLFPRVGQRTPKIKIRYMTRSPAQVRHTTWGGRAVPVERGKIQERFAEPAVLKVFDLITMEDVTLFAAAADALANNQIDGVGGAAIEEANDRIRQMSADLGDDIAEERHRLMVGACLGEVELIVYDGTEAITVDYGLTAITPPSTAWSDANATIVQDMEAAIQAFRNNNPRGLSPTHVLYNPGIYSSYFVGNDQWQEYVKLIPQMAQGFMRVPGGRNPFEIVGDVSENLFGLQWVKVEGTYQKRDAATNSLTPTARWPVNRLTLLNAPMLGAQWRMVVHPWMNPEANVNVEVKEPVKGDDVKNARVVVFENGLPYFGDMTMIQTFEVAA